MESTAEKVVRVVIGIPLAILAAIWISWVTVTAFVGGQAPLFFVDFQGVNPLRGILWLVFADSLVATLAYWVFMLIMVPITILVGLATKKRGHICE
jgi:hypothetical protein